MGGLAWLSRAEAAESVPEGAPAAPTVAQQQHFVSRWYGGQTLATDAAALLLALAATQADDRPGNRTGSVLGLSSVGVYGLGGPIVHLAHQNGWQALGSLLLRGGLPIVGGAIGAASEDCGGSDFCGLGGAFVGGLAGIVGAIAIDSAALGWERVPAPAGAWPSVGVASDGKSTLLTASGSF